MPDWDCGRINIMILVNDKEIDIVEFPDGTHLIRLLDESEEIKIKWLYESDAELFQVICLVGHLKGKELILSMPYLPNARMDRVKSSDEVFTLKYFAEVINSLNFIRVEVLDVHSIISFELIDRLIDLSPQQYIEEAINIIEDKVILYFPDEGAKKRYIKLFKGYDCCYGSKQRDWKTGKIEGLDIITNGIDLSGKTVLMVDDICSYGGTFYYSAKELINRGVKNIYSYATHTENSILSDKSKYYKLLEKGDVTMHFTTKSIFTDESDYIKIV